jgi:hypothetical protein
VLATREKWFGELSLEADWYPEQTVRCTPELQAYALGATFQMRSLGRVIEWQELNGKN